MDLGRSRSNSKIVWEKIMNKNRIPSIKFKIFLNHWSYTELKAVKDVRDGTHSSPKYIENGYPLVTSKNLTDSGLSLNDVSLISESDYNEINKRSKVEVGDILLGLIGTIGKPVLVDSDGFAIKNVGLIKNGGQIQNQFLLQYLKTNIFNKYIQIEMAGNTQKFLGLETLRNTKVPVPSPEEQSAIGSLFCTLDDLLASYKDNLANFQSLKATMLSKMFPKAGQKVPEIRLDGFEGEWGKDTLEPYLTESRISGDTGLTAKKITVKLWGRGVIEKEEKYAGSSNTQYFIRKAGQFIYSKLDFQNQAFGIIPNELDGYQSTLDLPTFDIQNIDPKFLLEYVMRREFYEYQGLIANGSRKAKRIHPEDFLVMPVRIPSLAEQQAIGSYFSNLDNLINSHREKISQLETLKKKLLQDMFI